MGEAGTSEEGSWESQQVRSVTDDTIVTATAHTSEALQVLVCFLNRRTTAQCSGPAITGFGAGPGRRLGAHEGREEGSDGTVRQVSNLPSNENIPCAAQLRAGL